MKKRCLLLGISFFALIGCSSPCDISATISSEILEETTLSVTTDILEVTSAEDDTKAYVQDEAYVYEDFSKLENYPFFNSILQSLQYVEPTEKKLSDYSRVGSAYSDEMSPNYNNYTYYEYDYENEINLSFKDYTPVKMIFVTECPEMNTTYVYDENHSFDMPVTSWATYDYYPDFDSYESYCYVQHLGIYYYNPDDFIHLVGPFITGFGGFTIQTVNKNIVHYDQYGNPYTPTAEEECKIALKYLPSKYISSIGINVHIELYRDIVYGNEEDAKLVMNAYFTDGDFYYKLSSWYYYGDYCLQAYARYHEETGKDA